MQNGSRDHTSYGCAVVRGKPRTARLRGPVILLLLLMAVPLWAGQAQKSVPEPPLPEAPQPQVPSREIAKPPGPCQLWRAGDAMALTATDAASTAATVGPRAVDANIATGVQPAPCPPLMPLVNWYSRFLNGPQVKPMTPSEKAQLAARNVLDPFNLITILGTSAISVGSDAHSPYGPGMSGFGRYVGVSFAQDMTGEFFGTFLIPSIVHQDPHYHRMPEASIPRRVGHAIAQVVWTQGDNGRGMVNYANLAGFAIDDEIGNLYVPGRETNLPASAARYGIGIATAPIDNFITEFLPDLARRVHIRVVLIQRIINQVAKTDAAGTP